MYRTGYNIMIVFLFLLPALLFSQSSKDDFINASVLLIKKDYQKAIDYSEKCISNNFRVAEANLMAGKAYYEMGNFEKAISCFTQANSGKNNVADLELAKAYASLNNNPEAVKFLENHLKSSYKETKIKIFNEPAFKNLQETDLWNNLWKEEWYTPAEITLGEAHSLISIENYNDALEILDDYLIKRPKDHYALFLRSMVFTGLKNNDNAIEDLSAAIEAKSATLYLKTRGDLYFIEGKLRKAFDDYNLCVESSPYDVTFFYLRAKASYHLKKYDAGKTDIDNYLKYFSNNKDAFYYSALINIELKDYQTALIAMNNAMEIDSQSAKYFYTRANIFFFMKSYQFAYQDYTMSLDFNPSSGETYLMRGKTRLELGNPEKACNDFQKADQLKNPEASSLIELHCRQYLKN
ncbi:MAG: hypothetical protein A2W91_10570 [Bacteroidetes bacterium GWF2_38_335]|nr:MAG: hypothetical protein A2W91_10570 [Bacteroidetes bacterium GWF2_38_335]OFY81852.1 MAG: hypothetical protein A2281_06470 [Bacteroidetes bacterium RIFOXYA12_FULL_38_20]HBS87929.1 hypothetical protein [Bacteroidales bacterium]